MTHYWETRVKLTNTQLNKLKSAAKNMMRRRIDEDKMKNCYMNYF